MNRQRPIDRHNHVCACVCVCDYKFFMNLQRLPWASPHFGLSTFVVRYVCCLWVKLIYFTWMVSVVQLPADVSCPQERMKKGDVVERRCKALKEHGFLNYFGPQRLGEDLWLVDETLPETNISYPLQRKNLKNIFLFERWDMYPFPGGGPGCQNMAR